MAVLVASEWVAVAVAGLAAACVVGVAAASEPDQQGTHGPYLSLQQTAPSAY